MASTILGLLIDLGTVLVSVPAAFTLYYAWRAVCHEAEAGRLRTQLQPLEAQLGKTPDDAGLLEQIEKLNEDIADKELDAKIERVIEQLVESRWKFWMLAVGLALLILAGSVQVIVTVVTLCAAILL